METKAADGLDSIIAAAAPTILETSLEFLASRHKVSRDAIVAALLAGHPGLSGEFDQLNSAAAGVILSMMS